MSTFSPGRAAGVFCFLCAALVALIGRVAYLETYGRQQTLRKAERRHQTLLLQARRGSIFDRNGFLLAGTIQTQTLFVDPKFMYEVYQQDGHSLIEMDEAIVQLCEDVDQQTDRPGPAAVGSLGQPLREGRREPGRHDLPGNPED